MQETKTAAFTNWYEVLGIPNSASNDDLTRVYHLLAARFHPDNQETGDSSRFLEVKQAFETLSDPDRRKEFDRQAREHSQDPLPVFLSKDFAEGVHGEFNRRLGILCLLYNQRKLNPSTPSLSVLQLEAMMAIPREHLDFTTWYLKQKRLVLPDDRSSLTITSDGIDFVEQHLPHEETVRKLLKAESRASARAESAA
jgi:curved DNA-binding protein CbpA